MELGEKLALITRAPAEEIITKAELEEKLKNKTELSHYIGYEISGLVHLGQLLTAFKIADLQKAGVKTSVWMADFHTVINNKLGGDPVFIKKVAREYFQKAMEIGIKIGGGDPKKTKFTLASEVYNNDYWATVVKIGKETTLARSLRSISIMGRKETEGIPTAWVMYPLMQAADIFYNNWNIAHAGLDQRRIHVVAREVGEKIAGYKPLALHNHMLLGLHKPPIWPAPKLTDDNWQEFKMSKSVRGSAVYVNDSEEEIKSKIKNAFCPNEKEYNPVLDWVKHIVFAPQLSTKEFLIKRSEKYGGDLRFSNYKEVEVAFLKGDLHPSDLKQGLGEFVSDLLKPFRDEFRTSKIVEELKKRITR